MITDDPRKVLKSLSPSLAEEMVNRQYALAPEVWARYGEEGRRKSIRDAQYHLSYLAEALAAATPALFVEYVRWARALFAGLNLPQDTLRETLGCMRETLASAPLPQELRLEALRYVDEARAELETTTEPPRSHIEEAAHLSELTKAYLDALLAGQRHVAHRLVLEALEGGTPVRDLYLHLFQPAQREVGRLWLLNRVSVAQEHYCTAATQMIMSQLYPRIFATERVGRRFVGASVGGELHEIGVRMVADFFEMEGWDTYYLGANTPLESIVRAVEERKADVLGISATMTYHVEGAATIIDAVRASPVGERVKILVGGYPFNLASDLWKRVGADGYAPDAPSAVALANRLLEGNGHDT
jgi:methanogenic corrinoid protein MtbC1